MQTKSDAQLLREYAAHRSEPAFAEIVTRHTDLVYSAACRQTGSPELAREIAQSVFTDLARKAPVLVGAFSAEASLVGWLFRGTRLAGMKLRRDEQRRQNRERQFMEHFDSGPERAPDWEHVAPVLDEAMSELGDADHEAVLLRYFKNQDFRAVGLALGVSEAAAQKRVSRAVERLRQFLAKRGVAVGASGLVLAISANSVHAAPVGMAVSLASAAVKGSAVVTTNLTVIEGALKLMAITKSKLAVGAILALTLTTVPIAVFHFTQRVAPPQPDTGFGPANTPQSGSKASGAATPEAGLERLLEAAKSGDFENAITFLTWRMDENISPPVEGLDSIARSAIRTLSNFESVRIVTQKAENDASVRARVESVTPDGRVKLAELRLVREGDEWKPAMNMNRSSSGSVGITFFLPLTPELGLVDQ